jgi:hypothetical protein
MSIASAFSAFEAVASVERSVKRRTNFVSAEERTEPVKKSPPRMRAIKDGCVGIQRGRKLHVHIATHF